MVTNSWRFDWFTERGAKVQPQKDSSIMLALRTHGLVGDHCKLWCKASLRSLNFVLSRTYNESQEVTITDKNFDELGN